ncbi:hypothetical protein [Algoriphagus resistens]|uniref:hypothetical protein n=1 Tax=Algoriphagus resistens TaxID=1750590 RepID=UPI0007167D22|nr:hypothetical protein [Algoriphagus resistens]
MKPLLLDFAETRKEGPQPHYFYDADKSLNVVEVNGERIPFIEASTDEIILLTKTKVRSEADDDQMNLIELETKTRVKQEADDESPAFLELQTKTLVKQESDDENIINY